MQRSRHEQDTISDEKVRDVVRVRQGALGKSMFYPMGRHLGPSLAGTLIGAAFAGAGWFLVVQEGQAIFGSIFGGVGALVALGAFYMMTNSLEVSQDGTSVHAVRRWLGIPVSRKSMLRSGFARFKKKSSMKSQSGGKHVIFYAVNMVDHDGNKMVVGEGFKGASEAKAAMRLIAQELGLRVERNGERQPTGTALFDEDVLTADF